MQLVQGWSSAWLTSTTTLASGYRNAACALLIALLWAITVGWRWRRQQLPPGPVPLPVVGNLLHLMGGLPHVRLAGLAERYGPLMGLRMGSKPMVVASSAHVAREFLQTHDRAFASRPAVLFTERAEFGRANAFGLAEYGPHWRHARKLAALQLFSPGRIQETQRLRREQVARLLQTLLPAADQAARVDLTRALSSMVEDLVSRMTFGRRMSDVAAVGGATPNLRELMYRLGLALKLPVLGDYIPWLGFLDYRAKATMDKLHADIDALWEYLISEREKQHKLNTLQGRENLPQDILDALLLDPSLSRVGVKGILLDLLAGAIDTTSVTLDWTMAELINNPSVLHKLQAEIEKVVGRERTVEEADLANLPYVAATVKETLRMHAPVPLLLPHMSTEACKVMGYSLPKGTFLMVNAWAIGRDPATWNEPERFKPERFLQTEKGGSSRADHHEVQDINRAMHQQQQQQLSFSWIPFGSGRRSCPGAPLAQPTLELTIANLVHCFDWRLPDGQCRADMSEITSVSVGRQQPLVAIPSLRVNTPF